MTQTEIKFTPTKASIVQRLLDEKLITAEEAIVLLEIPLIQYIPTPTIPSPQPYMPINYPPYSPYIYGVPNGTTGTDNLNIRYTSQI